MAMIVCTECGKKFSEKAQFCPNCGIPIADVLEEIKKREAQKAAEPKTEEPAKPAGNVMQETAVKKKVRGFGPLLAAAVIAVFYLGFSVPDWIFRGGQVSGLISKLLSLMKISKAPDLLALCHLSLSGAAAKFSMDPEIFQQLLHLIAAGAGFLLQLLGMMGKWPKIMALSLLFYLLAWALMPGYFVIFLPAVVLELIGTVKMRNSLRGAL